MSKIDLYPTTKSPASQALVATGTPIPGDKIALDVQVAGGTVTGAVNIRAPTGPFKITTALVTDVAANPIAVVLSQRVSVSIRNKGAVTIYFGPDNTVTANNAATGGWEVGAGEDFHIELNDSQVFFLIAPAGQTAAIKILEIAST